MVNKKYLLSFLMLFVFSASAVYAERIKNFVTILNGADSATASSKTAYSFVGQSIVFNTKETRDYISQSAFASVFYSTQSDLITFEPDMDTSVFTDIEVPVKFTVTSSGSNIVKVKYQIWQGSGTAHWESFTEEETPVYYDDATGATTVEFSKTIIFNKGEETNYIRLYAKLAGGQSCWMEPAYTIRLSSGIAQEITFTSPDRLTSVATIDPLVETTEYSINYTSATVSLYKGSFASGTPLYEVWVSSKTDAESTAIRNAVYDSESGKISYVHSNFIKVYNEVYGKSLSSMLTQNETYTIKIESFNESGSAGTDTVTFKALSGGVADILTYPSPFNPKKEKIKIRYLLAKDASVTIKIYDKAGKIVCRLIQSESRSAGTNEEEWDGRNYAGDTLATAPYIVEITAKSSSGEDRRYTALALVNK